MTVYYVDTNVFLRFFLKDNLSLYNQAELLLRKAKEGKVKIIVSTVVIFEIGFVLKKYYHLEKQEVIKHLNTLIALDYVVVDERDIFQNAIFWYMSSSNSLEDCFLKAKAQKIGAELFTFDKKLKNLFSSKPF